MEEQLKNQKINELAEEYGFQKRRVNGYFEIINKYPFVKNGDEDAMFECLEMIVQDRLAHTTNIDENLKRSVKDSINEALYRVYDEKSLNYLNDEFLKMHEIELTNYDQEVVAEKQYSYTDRIYNGY